MLIMIVGYHTNVYMFSLNIHDEKYVVILILINTNTLMNNTIYMINMHGDNGMNEHSCI